METSLNRVRVISRVVVASTPFLPYKDKMAQIKINQIGWSDNTIVYNTMINENKYPFEDDCRYAGNSYDEAVATWVELTNRLINGQPLSWD